MVIETAVQLLIYNLASYTLCSFFPAFIFREFLYNRGGKPIYYHGPRELCIVAGRPQTQFYPKILPLCNFEEERLVLTYNLSKVPARHGT